MERQHFVLVHGACHGAWCWYKVTSLLQSSGHRVTALDLAASGVHPKQLKDINSMLDYVEPLLDFLQSLPPPEKVVLVGHSMGGVAVAMAMERFPEKIKVAVFAAAFMVGPHLSFLSATAEFNRRLDSSMDSEVEINGNGFPTTFRFGFNFMASKLYQGSPREVLSEDKFGSVRRVYIVCDCDRVIPEDLQRWMIETTPPDEVKVMVGSDHMVMMCKPVELCNSLVEIAETSWEETH